MVRAWRYSKFLQEGKVLKTDYLQVFGIRVNLQDFNLSTNQKRKTI